MIFEVGPANCTAAGDAWAVRVQVDPTDWAEADTRARLEFERGLRRRYVDSMGNSALDVIEVWGDGRLLTTWELHDPARRTGPDGADVNQPKYRKGPVS